MDRRLRARRTLIGRTIWWLTILLGLASPLRADEADAWAALQAGAIVLFRHATAPGFDDPPGFKLDDCATQRNLDATGRNQARGIGAALRERRVRVSAVWSSEWCRCVETAELIGAGPVRRVLAFNSFFADRSIEAKSAAEARGLLLGWREAGTLVVVTHQVNITAITGISPASGEGIVLIPRQGDLVVVGRIRP